MGRKTIPVDKKELLRIISFIEGQTKFANRQALYTKVAEEYTKQTGVELSPALVYLRVKEWNFSLQTPVGKRGRTAGFAPSHRVRISRETKFSNNKNTLNSLSLLQSITPARFIPVAKRVKKGSMKAAVKLKCLDCCDYQPVEIKLCTCCECSLWCFRPYQSNKVTDHVGSS